MNLASLDVCPAGLDSTRKWLAETAEQFSPAQQKFKRYFKMLRNNKIQS